MRVFLHMRIRGALSGAALGALCACGSLAALTAAAPAAAEGSYSPFAETPSTALARYVRTLADDPKNFAALIGAGRASIAIGDAQAAAGFFARADEVNPRSPEPQAGMGSVAVLGGQPFAALPYFTRAQQLGAPVSSFALCRGLAYDLMGRQADAQADYRLALSGPDSAEARRRLALSLAISGNKSEAIATLGPLMARGDAAAARARAFVLALTGDPNGARITIDAAMPGNWANVQPFISRLATLKAGDKAAAVNLGIFPDSGGSDVAFASSNVPSLSAPSYATPPASAPVVTSTAAIRPPAPPVFISTATAKKSASDQAAQTSRQRVWLQLASGSNASSLPDQFQRLKSRNRDLFDGIKGYVASSGEKSRLVIGPFRGKSDAEIFAEDLGTVGIDSFSWTNSASDRIVPLGTQ